MCEICRQYPCDYRCPNYNPKREYKNICSYCGNGIQNGEEYIESYDDDYVHKNCIPNSEWLIRWYGIEIKKLED